MFDKVPIELILQSREIAFLLVKLVNRSSYAVDVPLVC